MTGVTTRWGSTYSAEVSSAEPDDDPVWVDISAYVIRPKGTTTETSLGRATELTTGEPGRGNLLLNNTDERFTPGNLTSPYFPWWKQGRRIRIRETFGDVTYELGDGYLEIPENIVRTQTIDGSIRLITLAVTWVDIIGRFRNGRKFISTLAEYIRFNGGTALLHAWPLGDAAEPYANMVTAAAPLRNNTQVASGSPSGAATGATVTPGTTGLPADDGGALLLVPSIDPADPEWVTSTMWPGGDLTSITLSGNDVLTVMAWVRVDTDRTSSPIEIRLDGPAPIDRIRFYTISTGWRGSVVMDGGNASIDPINTTPLPIRTNCWDLLSVSATRSGNQVFRRNLERYDAALAGVIPATADVNRVDAGVELDGAIAHVQVYKHSTMAEVDALHNAQFVMGYAGLERQTTGQRVNTILDYAGFPAYRRDIDSGTAVMSVAQLAGKTAATALEEPRRTEQGRLFAIGGRVQFHDRKRVYNV